MFIGHFGVALAAKKVAPKPSLGTLVRAALLVEFALFGIGAWLYATSTRARDRIGAIAFYVFVATLAVLYLSSVFGPPPPSVEVLAISGLFGGLFILWAYWIDRHRAPVAG